MVSASPATEESQDGTHATKRLVNKSKVKDELETNDGTEDNRSREDSQAATSSSDTQSLRRSRRSKSSAEAAGSEDKSKNKESLESRSSSDSQPEARMGGRTRRSKAQEEQSKSSPNARSSQSEAVGSAESPKGKNLRRRSSPALPVASKESSESESLEVKESPSVPKKRGRKLKVSRPSPLTIEPKEGQMNTGTIKDEPDASQKVDSQSVEDESIPVLVESQTSQDLQDCVSLQVAANSEEQSNEGTQMEVDAVVEKTESISLCASPREEQTQKDSSIERTSSQEGGTGNSPPVEVLEPAGIGSEQTREEATCDAPSSSVEDSDATAEELQVSEPSEEKAGEELESETQPQDSDPPRQEEPIVPVEEPAEDGRNASSDPELDARCGFDPPASNNEDVSTARHAEAGDAATPLQEGDKEDKPQIADGETPTAEDEEDVVAHLEVALADVGDTSLLTELTSREVNPGSPAKQKDLEALIEADVGDSPRTRGTWSPSASPSSSILKKGLKRPLEEEATSPLVKSRRVSFANPIQHQEVADDIDRRSPAIRTSSPRRSKGSGIPQPKYVTTPTKGLLILSPRNLHSPGYKSSKKCLISEMSQEPRPVSRDSIYPSLIGCSTPVEAVLPQISSNMWCRGFGQLVRARNIKTVGDLSALTPSEIKTLPIRSPKISNVKRALKSYELQRKGRGGDELKSFDEMMTSDLEVAAPQNPDEEDKTSGETLATELVDEPLPAADEGPEGDASGNRTPGTPSGDREHDPEARLRSEVDALTGSMTPLELGGCSPGRLLQIHEQLGGLMRRVAVELQTRLCRP
ncbi:Telomere-associated protein RIF1 [Liparis tanakae]|uniref:Telomere-associated protein RIF1 n=1 Tax=Liparis tanakae TaxID=230148 RepID=A0A4Z2G558_9TELE|nr:Telomere-associated protein RIF1 [Liparis tanakae]